jgi:hypothetical protein
MACSTSRLPQAGPGQHGLQVGGLGGQAALAAGLTQQPDQLGLGQPGRVGWGGGGRQERAGLGPQDATAGGAERCQHPWVVLAQQRAQLVVGLGAVPDRVLLGAGEHGDGADQLGVGWQRPVGCPVGTQDVGQHDRVGVVGLLARDRMALPVAGHRQWIDRIDRPASGAQAGDQQPPGGLNRDRDRRLRAVARLGQQLQQLGKPSRVVTDAPLGDQVAGGVDHGHVVVVL